MALKRLGGKCCEIKTGSQEMAAMMLMLIISVSALLKFISINIIAAISWLPVLISQLFPPRLFKAAPFFHSLTDFRVHYIVTSEWLKTPAGCSLLDEFEG